MACLIVEYYYDCLCRQDFSLDTDTDTVTVGGDRLGGNGQSVIAIISTIAGGHRHRSWFSFSGCCCCVALHVVALLLRSAVVGLHHPATHDERRTQADVNKMTSQKSIPYVFCPCLTRVIDRSLLPRGSA
jgi:hypothetical protein